MIIVEGPDGAGKSTLVRELADTFELKIGERGVADRDKLYEVTRPDTYRALSLAVNATPDEPVRIWDRLFWSEMVYADIVGRPCEFSLREQLFVKRILQALGTPIIVCYPPAHVVDDNITKEKQMAGVADNIGMIYERYANLFRGQSYVLWYDYTMTKQDTKKKAAGYYYKPELFEHVERYLDQRKERTPDARPQYAAN